MKVKKTFLKPIHADAFHHPKGYHGEIVGLFLVTPDNSTERLCYKIQRSDGEDYVPLSEVENGNYGIVDTIS